MINLFTRHRVAANLLMAIMLLSGAWALLRMNVQFLPNYSLKLVTVRVIWPGATSEDVERSVTIPIENELRGVDYLKKLTSTSQKSVSLVTLEFEQDTDMSEATERVRERVEQVRNLPQDAEPPVVTKVIPYEPIAKVVITGPNSLVELRHIAYRMERELLDAGISKINIDGLPDEEIAIEVPIEKLAQLRISLADLADTVRTQSQDIPAGTISKSTAGRALRSREQRRSIKAFANLQVNVKNDKNTLFLRDIADIRQQPQEDSVLLRYQDKPAVQLSLLRTEQANALDMAEILNQWLKEKRPLYGENIQLTIYDQHWQYIKERIQLLLRNGGGGLILILITLFLFLNGRIAFWVAAGIPASFMAALAVLYLAGGTVNMVSLFALIMTLGIIVDDTIVVGEETLTQLTEGHSKGKAIHTAIHRMLPPIFASSLTTICAFIPLMLITGIMGTIIFEIPLVVICVIVASLIECFLVLPGHLYHSIKDGEVVKPHHEIRKHINTKFEHFKEYRFRRFVEQAIKHRYLTFASAVGLFALSLGLIISGLLPFHFFPSPESQSLLADVRFVAGTPDKQKREFLKQLDQAALATGEKLKEDDEPLVLAHVVTENKTSLIHNNVQGAQYASMQVELISPDKRQLRNKTFIDTWREHVRLPAFVESLSIRSPQAGPPGKDLDIRLSGADASVLKDAALALQQKLRAFTGVTNIDDDLPLAQSQLVFTVNPTGLALGLTTDEVGRQLRAAFQGEIVQIYHLANDEVEVRVMLPEAERNNPRILEHLPIRTPIGRITPLSNVVNLKYHQAFNLLRHSNGLLTIHVTADVDHSLNSSGNILAALEEGFIQALSSRHGVTATFEGKAEEQQETLTDMRYGLLLGLILIYIILSWIFSSYIWPLAVMAVIPLGLTGAIYGHFLLHEDLTIMSLFGLFGLAGIVVNDSIILVAQYRRLHTRMPVTQAIIEASCSRLRPVLLTSLTTIAGLTPLLFERSLQAQFLIPMAISISFGLGFATLLILVVVPSLLFQIERNKDHGHGQ